MCSNLCKELAVESTFHVSEIRLRQEGRLKDTGGQLNRSACMSPLQRLLRISN